MHVLLAQVPAPLQSVQAPLQEAEAVSAVHPGLEAVHVKLGRYCPLSQFIDAELVVQSLALLWRITHKFPATG